MMKKRLLTVIFGVFCLCLLPVLSHSAVITFGVGSTDIGVVNLELFSDSSGPLRAEVISIVELPVLSIDVDGTSFFPDGDTENNLKFRYESATDTTPSIMEIAGSFLDTGFLNYSGTLLTAPGVTLNAPLAGGLPATVVGSGLDIKDPVFLANFGLQDVFDWTFDLDFILSSLVIDLTTVDGIFRRPATATVLAFESTVVNNGGQPVQVPEPGTLLLLGSGLVGLVGFGRRKFHKK